MRRKRGCKNILENYAYIFLRRVASQVATNVLALLCRIHYFFAILGFCSVWLVPALPNKSTFFLLVAEHKSTYFFLCPLNRASNEFISMEYRFRVCVIFVFPFDVSFFSLVCDCALSSYELAAAVMPRETGKFVRKLVRTQNVQRHVHGSFRYGTELWCVCAVGVRVCRTNGRKNIDIEKLASDASTIHDSRFSFHLQNWKRIHSNKSISCCVFTPIACCHSFPTLSLVCCRNSFVCELVMCLSRAPSWPMPKKCSVLGTEFAWRAHEYINESRKTTQIECDECR